ncbi:5247_t:CDS:2 [Acaulospora colombiana]|uniref:5247_t:CDS:1 n=1 Tax=Acaulospora colombiana TaxID=27376 RepID=A0ACA9NDD9_9GLOM|nr:5247_t:CDS:2 [Acaulospora colombiana]
MATVIPEQPLLDSSTPTARIGSSTSTTVQNQALRPHLNIPVREDHGLYNFFRKIPDEDSVKGYKYVTYEHMNERDHGLSRSWTTAELRRKSFRDLHIIWYLCRKEINLLATQKAELRRLHRLAHVSSTPISLRARMFVLNERRLALLNATAQVQWIYRPGYKDPAKKPKTKLERGAKMKISEEDETQASAPRVEKTTHDDVEMGTTERFSQPNTAGIPQVRL